MCFLCRDVLSLCEHNSAHKVRSTYWTVWTAWKLAGKGTYDLILHHWQKIKLQPEDEHISTYLQLSLYGPLLILNELCVDTNVPRLEVQDLARDSLTIHLPLCTSQCSCPENRNTNSVSMLSPLILCFPPPLHLWDVALILQLAMQLRNLASSVLGCERYTKLPYRLDWTEVDHSPKWGGLRAP